MSAASRRARAAAVRGRRAGLVSRAVADGVDFAVIGLLLFGILFAFAAVRYFVETNGSKPEEVASEVDRYCSWVGQACGYKIGHTEIVRQRTRAQKALGSRYDLRDFDDAVVKGGNVPMDVLAKNIDKYIATAKT